MKEFLIIYQKNNLVNEMVKTITTEQAEQIQLVPSINDQMNLFCWKVSINL